MDYVTQQYKLFPELAAAYAFTFAGTYISALYMKTNKEILQGEVDKLPEVMWAVSLLGLVFFFFFFFLGGGSGLDPVQTLGPPSVQGVPQCLIFVSGSSRIRTHVLVITMRTCYRCATLTSSGSSRAKECHFSCFFYFLGFPTFF